MARAQARGSRARARAAAGSGALSRGGDARGGGVAGGGQEGGRGQRRGGGRARAAAAPPAPGPPRAPPPPPSRAPEALGELVSEADLTLLEREELLHGRAMPALRRFSDALEALPADSWEARLRPCFAEMALNLESFNPVFTACLLQVQLTAGQSDYERRDACLQRLIQPLAGEYGLHEGEPLGSTHRALFREWVESVLPEGPGALAALMADPALGTPRAERLFGQMMRDVEVGGRGFSGPEKTSAGPLDRAAYALGYNLAVEYLADPEKTWLLDSFRKFDARVLQPLGRQPAYEFLVVHAEGEKEHADLGHEAVALFCPAALEPVLRRAMRDHDRDLAEYYNGLADILEGEPAP